MSEWLICLYYEFPSLSRVVRLSSNLVITGTFPPLHALQLIILKMHKSVMGRNPKAVGLWLLGVVPRLRTEKRWINPNNESRSERTMKESEEEKGKKQNGS